jgi:lipopolysaccharide/colanic/teichoic acid biosynthesis glycosyltransferase
MTSVNLRLFVLLSDLLWISVTLLIACFHPASRISVTQIYGADLVILLVTSWIVWPVSYFSLKLDGFEHEWGLAPACSWLFIGVLLLSAALGADAYLFHVHLSRPRMVLLLTLLYVGFLCVRLAAHRSLRSWGGWGRVGRMAIMGDGRVARELAAKVSRHPEFRTQVVGFFSVAGQNGCQQHTGEQRGISTLDIPEVLKQKSVTDLVIALTHPTSVEVTTLVERCRQAGITVNLVSQYYDLYVTRPRLVTVGGIPLLRFEKPREHRWLIKIKPMMDRILAVVLLVVSAPLLALVAVQLMIRKEPIFESEVRCGRDSRTFSMYRLAIAPDDPTQTWLMRLFIQTSLTELPQLWNVLRGEMSLVGPRPESPERLKHYSDWHRQRLTFEPGITGWAQVHGIRDSHSSDEKTRYDLHYILTWSPLLDVVVLLQTVCTIANRLRQPVPHPHGSKVTTKISPLIPEAYADSTRTSEN